MLTKKWLRNYVIITFLITLACFSVAFLTFGDVFKNLLTPSGVPNMVVDSHHTQPSTNSPSTITNDYFEGERSTSEFAVYLPNHDEDAARLLAESLGMDYLGNIGTLQNHYLFSARNFKGDNVEQRDTAIREVIETIDNHPSIEWYSQQTLRWRYKRNVKREEKNSTFTPQDPLFNEQWHLHNTGQHSGSIDEDMRVLDAWSVSRGRGVCVAIVDDGIMYTHPDLVDRYSAKNSYNFNKDGIPSDPMPIPGDSHGTMCAGATAATTNDVCGVGVAFEASVSGLRILGGPSSDAMEAQALTHMYHDNHIYSSSWGPTDNGVTLEGPGPLTKAAFADGVVNGRDGKGSVYVWAAGNGARVGDNCNYDGYASSRYVLTVGAVNHFGMHAYYSEPCSAIIISAPSSGKDNVGITTTDMNNDCTNDFTGTSASAPLVAGVVALMLEVNNNLTWRDIHHIFVYTARHNDKDDTDWATNGAGLKVNHKYGFGVVDANAAVLKAQSWQTVAEEVSYMSPVVDVYTTIPDNTRTPVTSTCWVEVDIIMEHVEVVFTSFHPYRSELRVILTSPSNTKSVLSTLHGNPATYEFQIISPKTSAKIFHITRASFGPSPTEWDLQNVTSRIVVADPPDGCRLDNNIEDITGNLLLVKRGGCEYTQKVKIAQEKGVAAVIVIPESPTDKPVEMTGMDSSLVIPSFMLSGIDGHKLLATISDNNDPVIGQLTTRIHKQNGLLPYNDWVFSTVRNWNESSMGEWTLSVYDLSTGGVGTFDRWQIKVHGTQGGSPPQQRPTDNKTKKSDHESQHSIKYRKVVFFVIILVVVSIVGLGVGLWAVFRP